MGTANVISMVAQPLYVAYLCFDTGGILDTRTVELSDAVNYAPYQKLCHDVAFRTIPGDPSRLRGDSKGIMELVSGYVLATLRAEDWKAALDSAVNARQNLYFAKYADSASVISTIRAYYSSTSATSKPNRLGVLSDIAEQQANDLQDAYTRSQVNRCQICCTPERARADRSSK